MVALTVVIRKLPELRRPPVEEIEAVTPNPLAVVDHFSVRSAVT